MEVHFTPELQAKLTHCATQQGRDADDLVQDVLARYLEDESQSGRLKFQALMAQWKSERDATSSTMEMAMCPSYQKIIAMGEDAIPCILAELRSEGDEPDYWFWALRAITAIDPVIDEDRGNIVKMAQAWLKWAEHEGYAW